MERSPPTRQRRSHDNGASLRRVRVCQDLAAAAGAVRRGIVGDDAVVVIAARNDGGDGPLCGRGERGAEGRGRGGQDVVGG